MTSVMLDLETLGTRPGSVILSVGAVVFEPYGRGLGAQFYRNVDKGSCWLLGMTEDQETVRWWAHDDRADARAALKRDQCSITDAVRSFAHFFKTYSGVQIWGHGSCFDVVLIEDAMRRCKVEIPWSFRNVRDTRTLFDYSGFETSWTNEPPTREGVHHDSLSDAKYQARCVQHAVSMIRGPV